MHSSSPLCRMDDAHSKGIVFSDSEPQVHVWYNRFILLILLQR